MKIQITTIKKHLLLAIILTIVALVYSNSLRNGFVWDDNDFVLGWPETRTFWQHIPEFFMGQVPEKHAGLYRPFRSVLYGFSYQLWELNSTGYHLQGLLLHLSNTILCFLFVYKLTKNKVISQVITLIFGVHPIHVEAITWITPTFDIIGVSFAVISFLLYAHWRETKNNYYFAGTFLFATLAYFTNEITLVLPGFFAIYDYFFITNTSVKKTLPKIKTWLALFSPAAGYMFIRFFLLNIGSRENYLYDSFITTQLLMSTAIVKQLWLLIFPWPLTVNHQLIPGYTGLFYHEINRQAPPPAPVFFDLPIFTSIGVIAFLGFLLYRYHKKQPVLCFLALWHFFAILPLLQIVPQSIIFGERYLYLASFGSISLTWLILYKIIKKHWQKRADVLVVILGIIVATVYGYISYNRNFDWYNEETLWQATIDVGPETPTTLSNLAKYHYEHENSELALELLEKAYKLNPNHSIATSNLGLAYTKFGKFDKAIKLHLQVYERSPNYAPNYEKLGAAYLGKGDYPNAIMWYTKFKEVYPKDPLARFKLAQTFHTAFVYDRAAQEYQEVLLLEPNNYLALWNLSLIEFQLNNFDKATDLLEKILVTNPDSPEVYEKIKEIENASKTQ